MLPISVLLTLEKSTKLIYQPFINYPIPFYTLIIVRLLPDTFNDLKVINMIAAASPSAINVALFARKYNSDYKRATELVCLTTIFCILTIPIFVYLLG